MVELRYLFGKTPLARDCPETSELGGAFGRRERLEKDVDWKMPTRENASDEINAVSSHYTVQNGRCAGICAFCCILVVQ